MVESQFARNDQSSGILLHIGYHKTGSTYLQNHFFKPENGFSGDIGENRTRIVRDIVFPDNFKFDPAACRASYQPFTDVASARGLCFVVSHERLSGYPPSGGYDRLLISQRLAATFPGARVLIVIREQVSLIRSLYSQYVTDGGYLSLSRFLELPEPKLGRMPGFRREVYEFDRLISYYQGLFGADRVLVLPFEMMVRDLVSFLGRIATFCGRSPPSSIAAVVTNARRPVTMQIAQRWGNRWFSNNELSRGAMIDIPRFQRRFSVLEPLFRFATPKWLDDRLHGKINSRVSEWTGAAYAESNARTSLLIGMDLRKYGYACANHGDMISGEPSP